MSACLPVYKQNVSVKLHLHSGSKNYRWMAVCVSWVRQPPHFGCLTASVCLQTKEQIPIRVRSYEPPGGKSCLNTIRWAAEAFSFYDRDVKSLAPLASPAKGTFLWVTGNPACTPLAAIKYLRICQFTVQPTEDINCVHCELWWNLQLESPSHCMFLVMDELMKFPGSHSKLYHKVVDAFQFASCITLSQHSWNAPLRW